MSLPLDEPEPQPQRTYTPASREFFQHPKPKHTYAYLAAQNLMDLRRIGKEFNVAGLTALRKDDLIISILRAQAESMNYRFGGGTLEILPEGFGFLRPKGMLPTDNDVYLSASQIRRFGLRNGDVIWGLIRPPREQEHYEALLRVETVNFSDPESSRRRPLFSQLTPIFPNVRINLDSGQGDWATRLVDMFAPIGQGQRALIVSPPKAGKTTLLKRIAKAITQNSPDIILMALLIDERPEEVTDISRSIEGEVIASTFDRPAEEHIRVANLALEKAKRLVEAKRDVVILLDSITRLARASNLTVPPSGRTLSGGLDSSGLYFPKRFFGAARNFEEGGSLTIVGTALTETGSRMDDVIYEEFKGTGNMELHLSRKLAEQRIFPAIDITKSGTRREELLIPEEELMRLWVLRKRIVGVDEAGALNLILDKLKQTKDNHEFLMSIKLN
ncbi:MAG: transcription termination factor Rho [Fretibacterium sp.]|nr:transcription termination factor Rho [Fretibacterium sp.]